MKIDISGKRSRLLLAIAQAVIVLVGGLLLLVPTILPLIINSLFGEGEHIILIVTFVVLSICLWRIAKLLHSHRPTKKRTRDGGTVTVNAGPDWREITVGFLRLTLIAGASLSTGFVLSKHFGDVGWAILAIALVGLIFFQAFFDAWQEERREKEEQRKRNTILGR